MQLVVITYKLEVLVACWLALLQGWTRAYSIESMSTACAQGLGSRKQIRLSAGGSNSAAILLFDVAGRGVEPRSCGIDVHVPNTHVISLQLMPSASSYTDSEESLNEMYPSPCPLAVFSLTKGGRTPRRHLRSVDMCDTDAVLEFSPVFTRQHISLVWMPPSGNFSHRLRAAEVVVTAVGSGPVVCKTTPHHVHFPCWRHTWYSSYCVAGELVCDGKPNCPEGGGDEDPQLCATLGGLTRAPPAVDARRNRAKQVEGEAGRTRTKTGNNATSTEKTNVLVNTTTVSSGTSIPAALSQYGPWGFVMLGMLICGSVLMVCGMWECCCRRSKTTNVATPPPPSLFVISSDEVPSAPPSYDELDQPPAYNTLFPCLVTSKLQADTSVQQTSDEQPNASARY